MKYAIPKDEQDNVMSSFWIMMSSLETYADNDDDKLAKMWVEQWFEQWNSLTWDSCKPRWIMRKAK